MENLKRPDRSQLKKIGNLKQVARISGIYLHIPFCRTICPFCSFAVLKNRPEKHQYYIELLMKEIKCIKEKHIFDFSSFLSIYYGGGTPSCFNIEEHSQLKNLLKESFNLPETTRWSIELNPEDVSDAYIRELKDLGINRISLGVQSFNDKGLTLLGRSHNSQQSRQAIQVIQEAGVQDLNLDLIFGYKGQTFSDFKLDLNHFLKYNPQHLSAYCLNIESKTAISRNPSWQKWQDEMEELIFQMYEELVNTLNAKGLMQYEVSNFAAKGFKSSQNLINWGGGNFLGLGMGAHSFVTPYRWGNFKRWKEYRTALETERLPHMFCEKLTRIQRFDEELMIQCRSADGIDLKHFKDKYSVDLKTKCSVLLDEMIENELLKTTENHWRLTTKGLWIADEVAVTLAGAINR